MRGWEEEMGREEGKRGGGEERRMGMILGMIRGCILQYDVNCVAFNYVVCVVCLISSYPSQSQAVSRLIPNDNSSKVLYLSACLNNSITVPSL
jgi:hypothetical protein